MDSGNFIKYGELNIPVVIISDKKVMNGILKNCMVDELIISGVGEDGYKIKILLPTSFLIHIKGRWVSKKVAIGITKKDFVFYDGIMGLECIN